MRYLISFFQRETQLETYDPDHDGIIDNAKKLNGHDSDYFQKSTDETLNTTNKTISGAINELADKSVDTLTTMEQVEAATDNSIPVGAGALKEVNNSLQTIDSRIQWFIDNGYLPDPNLIPLIPTMTSNTSPSGVASASSIYGTNYEAFRAFDGNDSTFWSGEQNLTSGQWLQYQFANAVIAKKITINNYNASSFTLQGSNDGSNFDTLTSGTLSNNTTSSFNFNNTTAYKYYKLSNLGTTSTNVAINTIQLYGTK